MKKVVVLCMLAALFMLAACGQAAPAPAPAPPAPAAEAPPATPEPPPAPEPVVEDEPEEEPVVEEEEEEEEEIPAEPENDNTPGIIIANQTEGSEISGAMIIIGNDESAWPYSTSNDNGDVAFTPIPGETYRISFNVANRHADGWRIRWARSPSIFGDNTAGDYEIVNAYPVDPETVATVIPAHFNQNVERGETVTLVVEITFDGTEEPDGLIGNIGLTGTAGVSSFTVNWITVEHDGEVIAHSITSSYDGEIPHMQ